VTNVHQMRHRATTSNSQTPSVELTFPKPIDRDGICNFLVSFSIVALPIGEEPSRLVSFKALGANKRVAGRQIGVREEIAVREDWLPDISLPIVLIGAEHKPALVHTLERSVQ